MLANNHDVAREQSKSQGFPPEVEKQYLSSCIDRGYDNMYSLGFIDLWESSTNLALGDGQDSKDVPPYSPPAKDFYPLVIQTRTHLGTAVKGPLRWKYS